MNTLAAADLGTADKPEPIGYADMGVTVIAFPPVRGISRTPGVRKAVRMLIAHIARQGGLMLTEHDKPRAVASRVLRASGGRENAVHLDVTTTVCGHKAGRADKRGVYRIHVIGGDKWYDNPDPAAHPLCVGGLSPEQLLDAFDDAVAYIGSLVDARHAAATGVYL